LNGIKTDNRLDNLSWGTRAENNADKKVHANYGSNIRLYTYKGRTLCLADWARFFEIPYGCLQQRICRRGLTFEEAIAQPCKGSARLYTHDGRTMCLQAWSRVLKIPYGRLWQRHLYARHELRGSCHQVPLQQSAAQ
jgi:hypothetical protein